jgi:hypothetical protein
VKANEQDAKSPSTLTGRFAAFRARPGVHGSDAPSHRRVFLVAALAVSLAAVVFAGSASARQTRLYTGVSFGPEGTSGVAIFKDIQSVAVDQTDGDVYVLDTGNGGKVYKFDSAGHPVDFTATGTNAIDGLVSV